MAPQQLPYKKPFFQVALAPHEVEVGEHASSFVQLKADSSERKHSTVYLGLDCKRGVAG